VYVQDAKQSPMLQAKIERHLAGDALQAFENHAQALLLKRGQDVDSDDDED
jgi:hypothetical protein